MNSAHGLMCMAGWRELFDDLPPLRWRVILGLVGSVLCLWTLIVLAGTVFAPAQMAAMPSIFYTAAVSYSTGVMGAALAVIAIHAAKVTADEEEEEDSPPPQGVTG